MPSSLEFTYFYALFRHSFQIYQIDNRLVCAVVHVVYVFWINYRFEIRNPVIQVRFKKSMKENHMTHMKRHFLCCLRATDAIIYILKGKTEFARSTAIVNINTLQDSLSFLCFSWDAFILCNGISLDDFTSVVVPLSK